MFYKVVESTDLIDVYIVFVMHFNRRAPPMILYFEFIVVQI